MESGFIMKNKAVVIPDLDYGLGAPGSRWKDHAAAYEKHFRCILVDNRGAGESIDAWSVYYQDDGGRHGWFDAGIRPRKCQDCWYLYG